MCQHQPCDAQFSHEGASLSLCILCGDGLSVERTIRLEYFSKRQIIGDEVSIGGRQLG